MHSEELILRLEQKSLDIKRTILEMVYQVQSGHLGGAFSSTDILTALYYHHISINPGDPSWEDRDRFILSKGHVAPLLYVVLADLGFFPREDLRSFRQLGSRLQGHPDMRKVPGVEATTGSLGQGLSIGIGLALAARLNNKNYQTYVLMGDGENQEGQVWEAAMYAGKQKLSNLINIIDHNGLQIDGACEDMVALEPLREKWESFGWRVLCVDGHHIGQILDTLDWANQITDKPILIIADTIKGKGVSFMENKCKWHGTAPNDTDYKNAISELKGGRVLWN
jgi:transketolase